MRMTLYAFLTWFRVRGHLVAPLIFFLIMFTVEGSFWITMSGPQHSLSHYSTNHLLFYVFAALATSQVNAVTGEPDQLAGRIESGDLETYLVRPQSLLIQLSLIQIGTTCARLVFLLPLLIFLQWILLGHASWSQFLFFIFLIPVTSLLNFLINFALSTLTFYFRDAYAFIVFKETLWWVLSGALIPLDLFSGTFQKLLISLPSAFVVFHPVKLLMGETASMSVLFATACLWTIVAFVAASFLWTLGVRKYQAYGS